MNNVITEKRREFDCLEAANKRIEDAKMKISAKLDKTKGLLQETAVMTGDLADKLQCDT